MFSFSFASKKKKIPAAGGGGGGDSSPMNPRRPRPRLERRNANKNIDYDALASPSACASAATSTPSSPEAVRATRSLDLSPSYAKQTSFRIGGSIEGEIDLLCRSLGLSGPEDFAIPAAAWEASRAHRSSADLLPRSRLSSLTADQEPVESAVQVSTQLAPLVARVGENEAARKISVGDGGIKGTRPPTLTPPLITTQSAPATMSKSGLDPSPSSVLAPPPSILLPEMEKVGSTWDLVRSFAPDDGKRRSFESEAEEEQEEVRVRLGDENSEEVTSTSNDDDSSSTTTEAMFVISPNGRFKRNIRSWLRGHLLGSGSFGTVYEGISE